MSGFTTVPDEEYRALLAIAESVRDMVQNRYSHWYLAKALEKLREYDPDGTKLK